MDHLAGSSGVIPAHWRSPVWLPGSSEVGAPDNGLCRTFELRVCDDRVTHDLNDLGLRAAGPLRRFHHEQHVLLIYIVVLP
jgi:hypothetical protein